MNQNAAHFVLCVSNADFEASLEPRKIYCALIDPAAKEKGLLRVVDESGDDYLFPEALFVPIDVPEAAEGVLLGAG